jgi:DNA polymerase I-like protein with 3'-5' exonuclease and polymerase domains
MGLPSEEWVREVQKEAEEKGLDFHKLAAAKNTGTPYEQVTPSQREAMKVILFGYTYGGPRGLSGRR